MIEIELNLPKPPSLNQFYAGRHFTVRQKYKKEYFNALEEAFKNYDEFFAETFEIDVFHNSRYDTDNCILAIKFTADYLRHRNFVKDDTKKYFKKLSIRVQEDLPKDIFKVKLKLYGYKELSEL
jgi:Holliday junction resolvase RusA-like endonuclease